VTPSKIVLLRWDGRITTTAGSVLPDDEQAILAFAGQATSDVLSSNTECVVLAYGELSTLHLDLTAADADTLRRMLMDADKEAHRAGRTT
jgi:hypothetical protein